MKDLRKRFNRFCFEHRNWGIPNLMLYIVLGSGIVAFLALSNYPQIYNLLRFDRSLILQGQVWRLISFVFTMSSSNILTTLIFLYCYYCLGRAMEQYMGTFRFNLFYLSGVLLMDIFAMIFGGWNLLIAEGQTAVLAEDISYLFSLRMTDFLHLSMLLCYATLCPDAQFLIFYLIPIKAWILALFYFIYVIYQIVIMTTPVCIFPANLFPLVALANYFLFFGKDAGNLIPMSWRVKAERGFRKKPTPKKTGTVPFPGAQAKKEAQAVYTHRCTVCGRNDVTNPELEFRYCSRCNGYFCYCQDHINNHTHIE